MIYILLFKIVLYFTLFHLSPLYPLHYAITNLYYLHGFYIVHNYIYPFLKDYFVCCVTWDSIATTIEDAEIFIQDRYMEIYTTDTKQSNSL